MKNKFESLTDFLKKGLRKQEGVYKLTFKNEKQYIGQSVDVLARIEEHLKSLQKGLGLWYSDAAQDNDLIYKPIYEIINQIQIEIYPCLNSLEIEQKMLNEAREHMEQAKYYNKQFYTPRKLGKKWQEKGRGNNVIF